MEQFPEWQSRTRLLLGDERLAYLAQKRVFIAGLGGVGGYAAELLCRAGVGGLYIVDGDKFTQSNLNRQLGALRPSIGKPKAQVIAQRLLEINPALQLTAREDMMADADFIELFARERFDLVIDAIDTLSPKVYLSLRAQEAGLPVLSSLGAGGRMDHRLPQIAYLDQTFGCPLGRYFRKRLRKIGGNPATIRAVFTPEVIPEEAKQPFHGERNKRTAVGTISYMPALFGCLCAGEAVQILLAQQAQDQG